VKLLICDDHALFREGLRYVLRELEPEPLLEEASEARELLACVERARDLDLVLLDLELPDRSGLDALRELRRRFPEVPVAILSAEHDPRVIERALADGACGFIPKASSGADLREALLRILAGEVYVPHDALLAPALPAASPLRDLTERQREVLPLMARGLTNREIANVLGIAEGTVKNHVAAILERLEIANRTEAAFLLGERDD
jgi:DNA-binding NarL/FixJ family response regulator